MSGSHKEITHTAVFVIAKIAEADFDVLVWTTTPWTLSANAALAVNPELEYALVKCERFEKPLVLAKNAIKHIDGEKQVLRLMKGEELIGYEYEAFFPWLTAQQELTHKIIQWDEVDSNEGSGVVHIAPGCGAEDYDLGKKFSLAEICPIDESGVFLEGYDFLSGETASKAAKLIFERLQEQGKLFKAHDYTHSYPACWRCKTEVLFRLVREWYIKTDEIKPQLIEAAERIGADAIRYLFAGASTASDVRFGFTLGEEARRKLLGFWNIYTFFMTYAEIDKPVIANTNSDNLTDKWLYSHVNAFVGRTIKCYESYNTMELVREFEQCLDDVSNWYVRVNRRRFWKEELDSDKQNAYKLPLQV